MKGAMKPQTVRFFRGQMQTIISRALADLDIKPVPSRRCFTLIGAQGLSAMHLPRCHPSSVHLAYLAPIWRSMGEANALKPSRVFHACIPESALLQAG